MTEALHQELSKVRRYLHQFPELSGHEYQTQRFLHKRLQELNAQELLEVGGTGLLMSFDSGQRGASILLRCDIDALPIQEINDFAHRSLKDRESHKCGHDGHATIMLGVALHFSEHPPAEGKVSLLWQPAEEIGVGARAVVEDEKFRGRHYDWVYALHNLPGYPLGEVICKPGRFSAGAISVSIKLFGQTSHAAEPEKGLNPGESLARIMLLAGELTHNNPNSEAFQLITPIYAQMGERSYGVSAGFGECHFTLRAWSLKKLRKLQDQFMSGVDDLLKNRHLIPEIDWFEEFYPVDNHAAAVDFLEQLCRGKSYPFRKIKEPFKWTEDVGLIISEHKGALFGLGAGEQSPALHNADYDFPDELIPKGVELFTGLVSKALTAYDQ